MAAFILVHLRQVGCCRLLCPGQFPVFTDLHLTCLSPPRGEVCPPSLLLTALVFPIPHRSTWMLFTNYTRSGSSKGAFSQWQPLFW